MAQKKKKKKIVVNATSESNLKATTSNLRNPSNPTGESLFGRKNFLIMLGGLLLIAIGMWLMSGGAMPSPDVWDESIIYSFRRTVLAPFLMLAGLVVEVYAIFKK